MIPELLGFQQLGFADGLAYVIVAFCLVAGVCVIVGGVRDVWQWVRGRKSSC